MTIETKFTDMLSVENTKIEDVVLSRAPSRISTELDGETVILDLESGVYSGLDEIGTRIWNLLEEPLSFAEIREAILVEYDVSMEQCTSDLFGFLDDLLANNLITLHAQ